jgi:glycosyltransferase involved in cell wall biosynthesis
MQSIIIQNFTDYEVIVCDGGSSDKTLSIINSFIGKIKLRIDSRKDHGIYDAMNRGIEMSCGRYLYFMGSDDSFYDGDVLAKVNKNLDSNAHFVYGNVIMCRNKSVYDGKFSKYKLLHKNICHQSIFFRRDVFLICGKYEIDYKLLADHVFNLKAFSNDHLSWHYVDMIVAFYAANGLSARSVDEVFNANRENLIKEYFGTEYHEIFLETSTLINRNNYLEKRKRGFSKKILSSLKKRFRRCSRQHDCPTSHVNQTP